MFSRLAPWLLVAACFVSTSLHAQTVTTGSIGGYVYDQQRGALAGVTITATSPDVPGTRQTVSTATGAYRLTDLPPGTYTLIAEHPGFARYSQQNIRVGAGVALGLEVVLGLADVSETVEVTHNPPMLEVLRPGTTINVSGEFQRDVPLSRRRDWAQFMELTPGVTSLQTQRNQNYQFHGAGSGTHVMQIDGTDAMSAQSNNNIWINLSTDAIADIQIKTAVADASVPLGTGAVANVVTRSGTDAFKGTTSLIYQNRRWNSSNAPAGSSAAVSTFQPDFSLGGPVRRHQTWFFGSYRHVNAEYGISRNSQQMSTLSALVPDFAPFGNRNKASFGLVKVTHRVGVHEMTGTFQYDRNPSEMNAAIYGSRLLSTTLGGPSYTFRLSSVLATSWLSRVAVSYNTKGQSNNVVDPSLLSRAVYERTTPSGGRLVGTNLLATLDSTGNDALFPYSKVLASADVSHTQPTGLGVHDLQFGLYFQHNTERSETLYANGGAYLVQEVLRDRSNPLAGSVPFAKTTASPASVLQRDLRADDIAFYLQDLWQPHSRLTIAAGLRVDAISRDDLLFDLRIQRSLEVGPRLGATWAVDAASRQIVHFALGRVHDALPLTAIATGTSTATLRESYDLDLNGSFETEFITPGASQLAANRRFDGSLRQPHVTELSAGYRRQLWSNTALDVSWLRRSFRDLLTGVEVNGIYDGGIFAGYHDETQNAITLQTNNRWNWPVYQGVVIHVTTRLPRLQVLGGYTRQWQRLEGTWQPNDVFSFVQPGAFPDDKAVPNNWRDHTIRAAGVVRLPWAVQIAADYVFQSGTWSGPITTTLAAPDPQFGPPSIRLTNGRIASNPLATTTRFAYGTRGDGQLRADALHVLNLRVARQHVFRGVALELAANVFNVTNGAADQQLSSTNLTSASYGVGTTRQLPRAVQLSMRLSF